ncbi:MAG TPA: hypothetical protein VIK30_01300 [Polyangia bacterium]
MKPTGGQGPSRLLDDPGAAGVGDSGDSWAVDLLRAETPYRAPPGRKQRVRLSLGQSVGRRVPLVLRPVIVAGVLIGCGAFASAALGHWHEWVARAYQRWAPSVQVATAPRPEPHGHGYRPPQTLPEPAVADSSVAMAPALAPPGRRETMLAPRSHHVPPTAAAEDTAVVLEAMRALRLERNPVRARVLLARYLDRHPTGTLAEEALAMSIEAAVAHHDADAASLGARYLKLYPTGPFHALASQTQR